MLYPYGTMWEWTTFNSQPRDTWAANQRIDWAGVFDSAVNLNGRLFKVSDATAPPFPELPNQPGHIFDQEVKTCGNGLWVRGFSVTPENETMTVTRGYIGSDFTNPSNSVNNPKPVIGTSTNKATILEFLKVWFYSAHNSTQNSALHIFLSTRSILGGFTANLDSAVLASVTKLVHQTSGAAEGIMDQNWPVEIDLTDGAGHGILVASDKVFLTVDSESTGDTNNVIARIAFRYKTVGITEYVGIVQSQG